MCNFHVHMQKKKKKNSLCLTWVEFVRVFCLSSYAFNFFFWLFPQNKAPIYVGIADHNVQPSYRKPENKYYGKLIPSLLKYLFFRAYIYMLVRYVCRKTAGLVRKSLRLPLHPTPLLPYPRPCVAASPQKHVELATNLLHQIE